MQPYFSQLNNRIVLTDMLFLLTSGLWIVGLVFRKLRFRWNKAYWVFAFYFFALLISTINSTSPYQSKIKLLSIMYLIGLAVLTANLVRSKRHLKHVMIVWIVATGCASLVGVITLLLFYIDRDAWLLKYTLSHYGTLPPGNYPRIQSTFLNPNMLCNYFSLSFATLLMALKTGWLNRNLFLVLCLPFTITCFLTLSPGIGGVFLIGGIWIWLSERERKNLGIARLGFTFGISVAVVFFVATLFTPIKSKTSPFHIVIPGIEQRMDPSSRLLAWRNSLHTFSNHPVTGKGIGTNIAHVSYRNPTGTLESLTDSHQMWLHLLGQAGIPGFLAICWIGIFFLRQTLPWQMRSKKGVIRGSLGIGFVAAFLYQGLSGSYEDARHLWVWMGLIAAISHSGFIWNSDETDLSSAEGE